MTNCLPVLFRALVMPGYEMASVRKVLTARWKDGARMHVSGIVVHGGKVQDMSRGAIQLPVFAVIALRGLR